MEDNSKEVGRRVNTVMAMVEQLENGLWEDEKEEFFRKLITELKGKPAISQISVEVLKALPYGKLGCFEKTADQNGYNVMAIRWVYDDGKGNMRQSYFSLSTGEYIGEA